MLNKPNSYRYQLSILILLLLPFHVSAKKNETILWQAKYDYVALTDVDSKNVKNDHPVSFTPQGVYELLASIRLTDADTSFLSLDFLDFSSDDDDDEGDTRLFNKSELKRIVPAIAKALSKAKPSEDVVFNITASHAQVLGEGPRSTSGRLFYANGQLNLIIGKLRVDFEQAYRKRGGYADISEKIDSDKLKNFRLKTGSRKSESDIDSTFVTDDAHFLKPYKSKFRKDWLLIDVETMQQQVAEQKRKIERKENIVEETVGIKEQTQQIDKEQEELKQKVERMERYLEAKEKQEAAIPVTKRKAKPAVQKPRTVEERLTELKSLNDKGFISNEVYQTKMKEILKDL